MSMSTSMSMSVREWYSNVGHHLWTPLPVSGSLPSPRYNHAAAVIGDTLYISGGTRNARFLSDFHLLHFNTSSWSSFNPNPDADAGADAHPTSPHHMIPWGNKLLAVHANPKSSNYIAVRLLDLQTNQASTLDTTGDLPVAREGHSLTLAASKLILFGGEDLRRNLLHDIHILDLQTMSWHKVQTTQPPPSPRYDHATALHSGRYLLVFGGCSHSTCFNDLHVLDLHTMEWSQPETRGDYVAPRAGHSGATVDGNWYIVGGGDNKSGARETLVLDMTKLVWSVVATVNPRDPLASEGISICSASVHGDTFLVAFGGYNGIYNNEVFVMRPKLKESVRPRIYQSPAAAAAAASVSAAYSINSGKQLEFTTVDQPETQVTTKLHQQDEKRLLESSLALVRAENSMLRGKIGDVNSTQVELTKELESVQGQLIAERSRCFSLEAQIVRFQGMLEILPAVESEVKTLREEKLSFEQAVDDDTKIQRQGSRGVWQWFSSEGNSP